MRLRRSSLRVRVEGASAPFFFARAVPVCLVSVLGVWGVLPPCEEAGGRRSAAPRSASGGP